MNTVVLLTVPLASNDIDTSANGLNNFKNHASSDFDHLELTNAIVLLMILSVSCWTSFESYEPINRMVPLTMPSVACDAYTVPTASYDQESCETLFLLSSSNKPNSVLDAAVNITW